MGLIQSSVIIAVTLTVCWVKPAAGQSTSSDRAPPKQSVNPGINDSFLDKDLDVDAFVERFETESREIFRARDSIVKAIGLNPGQAIADVGTGTGLFLKSFAHAVGKDGKVFATDIAARFLERARRRSVEFGLSQVEVIESAEDDVRLPPRSVDFVFLCDVYHHFEYPNASLRSIHKALKTDGQFIVIDFERIPGVSREWLLNHVRAGKETFRQEIENAGFELIEEIKLDEFGENYFLKFRRI